MRRIPASRRSHLRDLGQKIFPILRKFQASLSRFQHLSSKISTSTVLKAVPLCLEFYICTLLSCPCIAFVKKAGEMLNPQPEGKPRSCSSSMQLVAHALYVASFAGYIFPGRKSPQSAPRPSWMPRQCCELTPQKTLDLIQKKHELAFKGGGRAPC